MLLVYSKVIGCHRQQWSRHATDRSQKQFWFCNPTMVKGVSALPSTLLGTVNRRTGAGATRTRGGGGVTLAMTTMTGNNYNNTHTCNKHIKYII